MGNTLTFQGPYCQRSIPIDYLKTGSTGSTGSEWDVHKIWEKIKDFFSRTDSKEICVAFCNLFKNETVDKVDKVDKTEQAKALWELMLSLTDDSKDKLSLEPDPKNVDKVLVTLALPGESTAFSASIEISELAETYSTFFMKKRSSHDGLWCVDKLRYAWGNKVGKELCKTEMSATFKKFLTNLSTQISNPNGNVDTEIHVPFSYIMGHACIKGNAKSFNEIMQTHLEGCTPEDANSTLVKVLSEILYIVDGSPVAMDFMKKLLDEGHEKQYFFIAKNFFRNPPWNCHLNLSQLNPIQEGIISHLVGRGELDRLKEIDVKYHDCSKIVELVNKGLSKKGLSKEEDTTRDKAFIANAIGSITITMGISFHEWSRWMNKHIKHAMNIGRYDIVKSLGECFWNEEYKYYSHFFIKSVLAISTNANKSDCDEERTGIVSLFLEKVAEKEDNKHYKRLLGIARQCVPHDKAGDIFPDIKPDSVTYVR